MKLGRPRWLPALRCFSSMTVFDRNLKTLQKERSALLSDSAHYDYLKAEIAERLADRLWDIKDRRFRTVLDLGCGAGHLLPWLEKRGDVETLYQLDTSRALLHRDDARDDGWDHSAAEDGAAAAEQHGLKGGTKGVRRMRRKSGLEVVKVVGDEENLGFPRASLDLVISNLSLHWVNDLPGALAQARYALKPDGVFIGAMFGENTLWQLRNSFVLAEQERQEGVSPHVSPFAGVSDIGNLIQRAGFNIPTIDTEVVTIHYRDAFLLMHELQGMGENNATLGRVENRAQRDVIYSAASIYQHLYQDADAENHVPASFQIIYMIGWTPHESQPLPKTRGSAQFSFSELQEHAPKVGIKKMEEMAELEAQRMLEEDDDEDENETAEGKSAAVDDTNNGDDGDDDSNDKDNGEKR